MTGGYRGKGGGYRQAWVYQAEGGALEALAITSSPGRTASNVELRRHGHKA